MRALFEIVSSNVKERFRSRSEADREKFEAGILQLEQNFKK